MSIVRINYNPGLFNIDHVNHGRIYNFINGGDPIDETGGQISRVLVEPLLKFALCFCYINVNIENNHCG